MKFALCILCNLLTLAATRAQEIAFALEPVVPTPVDAVRLTITRNFPSPCYATTAGFHRNGNTIEVQLSSTSTGGICPAVITPRSATVSLGRLASGTYLVKLTWQGVPGEGKETASHTFHVLPQLTVYRRHPVGIRFPGTANATYQVKWSSGLEQWFDLGPPVKGTGEDIVIEDGRPPAGRRFYRLEIISP